MTHIKMLALVVTSLLFATSLCAGGDTPQSESQEAARANYESMLEEAEIVRAEAETARKEAMKAAEGAREMMANEQAREQKEVARTREELSRTHRALREASREVARAHRDLSRSERNYEITHHVNLGDRAIVGVVLGKQTDKGVQIIGISPDGPAERAGLQQGDVLVSIRGIELAGDDKARQAVFRVMREVADGEELAVTVDRNGQTWEYTVTAERREPRGWQSVIRIPEDAVMPEDPEAPHVMVEHIEVHEIDEVALAERVAELTKTLETRKYVFISEDGEDIKELEIEGFSEPGGHAMSEANIWFGLPQAHGLELASINEGLGAYFKTDRGVLVIKAREGNSYQLESGDVILSVGATEVSSPSDMMRALRDVEPGNRIEIDIKRNRKDKTLNVVVPENRLGFR